MVDCVKVAVFTVGINDSIRIHDRRVNAPFKSDVGPLGARAIGNTGDGSIGLARTRLIVGVLEFPFDTQVGVELGDEKGAILSRWAKGIRKAVGTEVRAAAVFVVVDVIEYVPLWV